MKKEKGITLVSLVVTIIILIILAGISINIVLGDNGIINKAQQARENTLLGQEEEAKQLNSLYSQLNYIGSSSGNVGDIDNEAVAKLEEFKSAIAVAITNEGINTLETDTAETMVENIGKILQERTKDATATADNITQGKTAWVNGQLITGNGTDVNNSYNSGYNEKKTIVSLGSGSSIDVKSVLPDVYAQLTADNFITQINNVKIGWSTGGRASTQTPTYTLDKSYNADTGVYSHNAKINSCSADVIAQASPNVGATAFVSISTTTYVVY